MGGLEGEGIDVPGAHAANIVLVTLDNLNDVLGVEAIDKLFLIDRGGDRSASAPN